jgi:hypothetical protein
MPYRAASNERHSVGLPRFRPAGRPIPSRSLITKGKITKGISAVALPPRYGIEAPGASYAPSFHDLHLCLETKDALHLNIIFASVHIFTKHYYN